MAIAPAIRDKKDNLLTLIQKSAPAFEKALPAQIGVDRFVRIVTTTVKQNPALLNCDPFSTLGAIMESAQLGLEIDPRGLAYLVPYGNKCTLIIGYKGLMDLAYRSEKIRNIYAELVFESDEFSIELGSERKLHHRVDPLKPRSGNIICAYAVAEFRNGGSHFEWVQSWEWLKRQRVSAAGKRGSGPWKEWEEEMIKKTAIRKLCKYLPLSPEVQRAVVMDELADARVQDLAYKGKEVAEEMTLDVDYEEMVTSKAEELKRKLEEKTGEEEDGDASEEHQH
jgi:recombination protein RecT